MLTEEAIADFSNYFISDFNSLIARFRPTCKIKCIYYSFRTSLACREPFIQWLWFPLLGFFFGTACPRTYLYLSLPEEMSDS
jgi:hypothetical protein